jgi:hypothetical protein
MAKLVKKMVVYKIPDHECGHHTTLEDAYRELAFQRIFEAENTGRRKSWWKMNKAERAYRQKVEKRLARWLQWADNRGKTCDTCAQWGATRCVLPGNGGNKDCNLWKGE